MQKTFLITATCLIGILNCQEIKHAVLDEMREEFLQSARYRAMQNAVSRNHLSDVAMDWNRFSAISHVFSHTISNELRATSQSQSGRCWFFAALNMLRVHVAREHNLNDFEFSQSYLFFWDKLEKANYFLETVIETADRPYDDRLVSWLFRHISDDGGDWHMAVNLINKYGVVPQSVFPENAACYHSGALNRVLDLKLREDGIILREMIRDGRDSKTITQEKDRMIKEIYRILSIHMGTPPVQFNWDFLDKNRNFQSYRNLTPYSFYENHVKIDLNDYVCLGNSPREETPYYNVYDLERVRNVVEGCPTIFLNVPIEEMKRAAALSLLDDEPVYFTCDVTKTFHLNLGVMDTKLYDLNLVYDLNFGMTKEQRMNYGHSSPAHAMLFTGVNIEDDLPTKWRVENSWGTDVGEKGYFLMTDEWFDEYMFEVVVHIRHLPEHLLQYLDLPPIPLEPWDPFY